MTAEDLVLNETRTEEIQAASFVALEAHLNKAAREMPTPVKVLTYHRSRFIEVWSCDGKRLIARYTPTNGFRFALIPNPGAEDSECDGEPV